MSEGSGAGAGDLENGNQGISVVHVSNPTIQVQPVIHTNQSSLLQAGGNLQTIQVVRVSFCPYIFRRTKM